MILPSLLGRGTAREASGGGALATRAVLRCRPSTTLRVVPLPVPERI